MVVERSGRRAASQPSGQARRERAQAAGAAGAIKISAESQQLIESGKGAKYAVVKGDTLWGIWSKSVKSNGVSFEQFKAANPHLVENPARNAGNLIVPGDEVIIPQPQGWSPQGGGRTNAGRATAETQAAQGAQATTASGQGAFSPAEQAQTAALNKFIEDAIRVNVEQQAGRTTPQAAQQQMQSAQRDMIRKLEQIERGSSEEVLKVNEARIKAAIEEGTLAQLQQAAPAAPAAPAPTNAGRAPAAAGAPAAQGGRATPQAPTAPAGSAPAAQAGRAPSAAQGAAPAPAANAGRATGQAQGAATAAPAQGGVAQTQALPRMSDQQYEQMMSKSQPAVDRFVEAAAKLQLSNKDKKLTPEQLQTQTIELLKKLATEIDANGPAGFAPEGLALVSDEGQQAELKKMVQLKAQQLMISAKSPAEKKTFAWAQLEAPLTASLQLTANKADNFAGLEKSVSLYVHDLLGNQQLAEELIKEKIKPAIENARKAAPAAAAPVPPAAGASAAANRR